MFYKAINQLTLGEYELLTRIQKITYKVYAAGLDSSRTDLSEREYIKILKELDRCYNKFIKINSKVARLIAKKIRPEKYPYGPEIF